MTNEEILKLMKAPTKEDFDFKEFRNFSWAEVVKDFNENPQKYGGFSGLAKGFYKCKICGEKLGIWRINDEDNICPNCGTKLE